MTTTNLIAPHRIIPAAYPITLDRAARDPSSGAVTGEDHEDDAGGACSR